jgi:hypothetical protein
VTFIVSSHISEVSAGTSLHAEYNPTLSTV